MSKLLRAVLWIIVLVYAIISLYPFVILLFQSLKTETEIWNRPFALPTQWLTENFVQVWNKGNFAKYTGNSIFVTGTSLLLSLLFGTMAGYAFSRLSFIGKQIHFSLLVGVLLIPASLLIVPVYVLSYQLNILNTHAGLLLPYIASGIILPTILLKSVFDSIPKEMFDAAKIDGCGEYRMLFQIAGPVGVPMLATLCILLFRQKWNEYVWAQVSLQSPDLYTLPVGMANLSANAHNVGYGTVYAGMAILTVPIILLFISAQRLFISALTAGAVKG